MRKSQFFGRPLYNFTRSSKEAGKCDTQIGKEIKYNKKEEKSMSQKRQTAAK